MNISETRIDESIMEGKGRVKYYRRRDSDSLHDCRLDYRSRAGPKSNLNHNT
jgi:hypothetical protein